MIISALLTLIYNVLSVLLVFNLPELPSSVTTVASEVVDYIGTGISVMASFVGSTCMGVIALLFQLVIGLNAAYLLYSVVFWVIRKVPVLNRTPRIRREPCGAFHHFLQLFPIFGKSLDLFRASPAPLG